MSGPGAGGPQTASAVLGDVIAAVAPGRPNGAAPMTKPVPLPIVEDVVMAATMASGDGAGVRSAGGPSRSVGRSMGVARRALVCGRVMGGFVMLLGRRGRSGLDRGERHSRTQSEEDCENERPSWGRNAEKQHQYASGYQSMTKWSAFRDGKSRRCPKSCNNAYRNRFRSGPQCVHHSARLSLSLTVWESAGYSPRQSWRDTDERR